MSVIARIVLRKQVPHGWWERAARQGMASAMPEGHIPEPFCLQALRLACPQRLKPASSSRWMARMNPCPDAPFAFQLFLQNDTRDRLDLDAWPLLKMHPARQPDFTNFDVDVIRAHVKPAT